MLSYFLLLSILVLLQQTLFARGVFLTPKEEITAPPRSTQGNNPVISPWTFLLSALFFRTCSCDWFILHIFSLFCLLLLLQPITKMTVNKVIEKKANKNKTIFGLCNIKKKRNEKVRRALFVVVTPFSYSSPRRRLWSTTTGLAKVYRLHKVSYLINVTLTPSLISPRTYFLKSWHAAAT